MQLSKFILFVSYFISLSKCEMKPFVVGGLKGSINNFPYSAFVRCVCKAHKTYADVWICGSSIVNQYILLTAAHCVTGCNGPLFISVSVGNEYVDKGTVHKVNRIYVHKDYDSEKIQCDIALVKVNIPIKFNSNVKRISLMKSPPYEEEAFIAGWGLVNEKSEIGTNRLMYTNQYVWSKKKCFKLFETLTPGTLCASSKSKSSYVSHGDSGSALVVRGYIQIGLVSCKEPKRSLNVIIYTDIAYYYDWIQKNAVRLMCS